MQLYIMRHGEANNHALSDSQRELTPTGISEVSDVANVFRDQTFDLILVSPYVRAQQTVKTILDTLNIDVPIQACDLITPSGSPTDVHHYLDGLLAEHDYQNILIVSHMPLLSFLLAELTSDEHMPIFQTASAAQIHYHTDKMKGDFIKMFSPFDVCGNVV